MRPVVKFFFEFASPYSYLAAHEIDARVSSAGGQVHWEPIDIRQVWGAQGVLDGYLAVRALKSSYIQSDVARCAAEKGVIICPPRTQGQSFTTAKLAYFGLRTFGDGRAAPFLWQIWQSYFSEGLPISTAVDLAKCVMHLELDAQAIADYAGRSEASAALQANNRAAVAAGCFGIPWFTCAGESFFGQDRIDHLVARLKAHEASGGA
jgi:2-hydroxychromene-2-carboxylate isomerase